jgi:hypothetical protein
MNLTDSIEWNAFKQAVLSALVRIEQDLAPRSPTKLKFGVPHWVSKVGGVVTMAGSTTVTDDHDLEVPLIWSDDVGPVHPDTTGTTVTSDNTAVISAGDVSADGSHVILRTAGDGVANVTVTNGTLTDTIAVTVGTPVPNKVALDVAHAVPVAKGTAA